MDKELTNNLDDSTAHRETVARYFSTKANFGTVVYSQEDGACNDYMGFHMRRRRDVVLNLLSECLDRIWFLWLRSGWDTDPVFFAERSSCLKIFLKRSVTLWRKPSRDASLARANILPTGGSYV